MCDNPISEKINISSNDKDEFSAANLNVEYQGKTTGMTTSLKSRPKSTILISDKTTFETVGDICDKKDYLESKGVLTLQHILFGPLDTFGSKLTFENMYFHFKDLKLNLIVKFFYNPLSICRESPDPNAKKDYSITFEIDKTSMEKGPVDLKLFYATNGKSSDINSLFYDLEEQFKNYDKGFSSFYDYFVNQLAGSFQFVRKIEDEFKKIYCKNQKDQNINETSQKVKIPYILYKQKIDILKRLDIYSTIYFSKS